MHVQTPTGRYGHSAKIMNDGKLVIFGGWGKGGCQNSNEIKNLNANTLCVLNIKNMTWHIPHPKKTNKKPMLKHLFNHGCCVDGDALLTFGGFDGKQANNEFHVINLDFGL